ncbi:cytochrome P450 [Lasiosphaeris hirsuta]|uniref:Cytochrome P450 n=1 Tax=Lasiosphaeris hirsuta TaxID=260670 RepID=A0AA40AYQ3_9PEZI|nr:cytochrome P450 [Lasiosphaeris hirsuta]
MAYNVYLIVGASIALSLGYAFWRLLPVPLPGLPHFPESTKRMFGDGPTVKGMGQRTREPSAAVFALCRNLGSPVVQFLLTSITTPSIVIDDPREVEDILLRRNKEFDRSELTTHLFSQILPHSTLAQLTTPALKAQKRLWSDVMHPDFLRRVVAPNLQTAARELVELWTLKAERAGAGQSFDVSEDFQSTALDAIWVAVLGSKIGVLRLEMARLRGQEMDGSETARLVEVVRFAVEKGSSIINAGVGSLWPALTYFFMSLTPSYRRFKRIGHDEVQKIMTRACDRFHRLSEASSSGGREEGEGDSEHDTCAMDFVLRREIMTAKKEGKPAPDPTRDPAMLDELWLIAILEADIPILDATIEETARCSATAAITTRRALVDTEVLGHRIPAGTNVLLNLRIRDEPFEVDESCRSATSQTAQSKRTRGGFDGPSGRELDRFEPRRWLAQDNKGNEVFDAYSLPALTFGGGFRGCFGKRLAMLEIRIIIATLMLNFEFLPLPAELSSLGAEETVFRKPLTVHVNLKPL